MPNAFAIDAPYLRLMIGVTGAACCAPTTTLQTSCTSLRLKRGALLSKYLTYSGHPLIPGCAIIRNLKMGHNTGISKVIEGSGSRINYFEQGQGDTVVLLSSLGRSVSDFDGLSPSLAESGYRVVGIEMRGLGESGPPLDQPTLHDYADDIALVVYNLEELVEKRVHVLGHAFGNRVARTFAADYPELVKSVILLAAGGLIETPPDIQKSLLLCFNGSLSDAEHEKHVRTAFFASGNEIPQEWIDGWHMDVAQKQIKASRAVDMSEWWSGGSAPILILQGENDAIAPVGNALKMKGEFPDRVTVAMIPDCGHAMLPEQPEIIKDETIKFLKENE